MKFFGFLRFLLAKDYLRYVFKALLQMAVALRAPTIDGKLEIRHVPHQIREDYELKVKVIGPVSPENVSWFKGKEKLDPTDRQRYYQMLSQAVNAMDAPVGSLNVVLRIEDVDDFDAGEYRCVIQNAAGRVEAKFQFEPIGMCMPRFVEEPKISMRGDEKVKMEFEARSHFQPTYVMWYHNGKKIDFPRESRYSMGHTVEDDQYYHENLIVSGITSKKDQGLFVCVVKNPHGELRATFDLQFAADMLAPRFIPKSPLDVSCHSENGVPYALFKARVIVPGWDPRSDDCQYAFTNPAGVKLYDNMNNRVRIRLLQDRDEVEGDDVRNRSVKPSERLKALLYLKNYTAEDTGEYLFEIINSRGMAEGKFSFSCSFDDTIHLNPSDH